MGRVLQHEYDHLKASFYCHLYLEKEKGSNKKFAKWVSGNDL